MSTTQLVHTVAARQKDSLNCDQLTAQFEVDLEKGRKHVQGKNQFEDLNKDVRINALLF